MTTTHICIYTIQQLRYPQGSITIFAYIPAAFWTTRHLTDTFKDH